jgi:hypothetical protein
MDTKEKDFIKDGLENEAIIDIIKKIRAVVEVNCNDEIIENLKKEYAFFIERYPMLFDISCRTNEPFNWEYLNYFLVMRKKIIDDELTSEKASVIVGNEWFNKHVNVNDNGNINDNEEMKPPNRFTRRSKKAKTSNSF